MPPPIMAPKGVKRGAPSPAGGSRKRTNADPVGPKVKDVVRAIKDSESLPEHCKEMLSEMVSQSLTVFAADRHAYQKQAVEMFRETLNGVKAQLEGAVSKAQAFVDHSDRDKASRDAALAKAQKDLERLEQGETAAHEAVASNKANVATAKANLASAEDAVETKDDEVTSTTELKEKLEAIMKDVFEPAKTSKAKASDVNRMEKVFTEAGLEAGLIDSLPDTFRKDPEARGTFDGLVTQHVESQAAKALAKCESSLKNAEQSKANLANAKAAAEAALTAAQEKDSGSKDALHAAEAALKEGKAALKQAEHAVANFEKDFKNAGSDLEDAKEALTSFTEGALKSFSALKDLATPPEPEPEVAAPEAPAAETAQAQ